MGEVASRELRNDTRGLVPVVTQDDDYVEVGGLSVIRV
jgi:hypothetical protein